ncbi:MAG: DNA polymerase III subunit beta [Firmicutes bacterium HGW-Firmicutes-7]|nr:MAG: DNA polymerase III subunit beta [Firmicutes bacterium HGW-Firmicutes-7]
MQIKCNKMDLLNGVNTVLKAVSSRTTLPILQCILLQATNDELKLISNDLELGIESKVSATIKEKGSIALEARIFSEIVKKLPDNEVTITVDENHLTTIVCEKSKFNISGQPGNEFIQLPQIEKNNSFTLKQGVFKEMIRQTIFSIAIEEIRPIFTGELLEVKNSKFNIVSVDGYRVSIREIELNHDIEDFKVIVPGKTLNEINKILSNFEDDYITIYYTDKHILFELEDSIVVSRLLEGDFPKYDQIFSKDYDIVATVDRKSTILSLERAALITRENKKNPIKIEIKNQSMIITSNTEIGNVYEEIDIKKEGNEIEIAFNPKYLIDALKVIDDELVNLQFTNALNPCIIRKIDGDDYKYLILPIRLNN